MFRSCFGGKVRRKDDCESAAALSSGTAGATTNANLSGKNAEARGQAGRPSPSTICHTSDKAGRRRFSLLGAGAVARGSPPDSPPESAQRTTVSNPGASRTNANASRLRQMDPEDVSFCEARSILDGLRLKNQELGRGSYGVVVPGTYRGVACAVKVMLSKSLDRAALRELLLGPTLVHPNIVMTFASRCAVLTDEFFDFLEGGSRVDRDPALPRVLEPLPINSDEGFGDPRGVADGADPTAVLHNLLHSLGAETNMVAVLVIQQHCDRGTLENAIRRKVFRGNQLWSRRVARRALLRTAAEAGRGLLHLHDANVVHGDFKPANVLLSSSHEDRRGFIAKVADFGLSHVLPQAATSMSTDCTGSVAYMAPEAFDGKASRATDVWSFGVTLWEMLTAEKPYQNAPGAVADVIREIRGGRLELRWPTDPRDAPIVALGRRCLSRRPQDRPSLLHVVEELVGIERTMRAELLAAKAAGQQEAARAAMEAALALPAARRAAAEAAAAAAAPVRRPAVAPAAQAVDAEEVGEWDLGPATPRVEAMVMRRGGRVARVPVERAARQQAEEEDEGEEGVAGRDWREVGEVLSGAGRRWETN